MRFHLPPAALLALLIGHGVAAQSGDDGTHGNALRPDTTQTDTQRTNTPGTDTAGRDSLSDDTLLCLGTHPGFMMTIDGARVRFDYLGDGLFSLDPPLERGQDYARHTLVTSRERWPVYFERRDCRVLRATLSTTVEIAVPTSAGTRPMTGCCKWHGD